MYYRREVYMDLDKYITAIARRAKEASRVLADTGTGLKNKALSIMAEDIIKSSGMILKANTADIKKARAKGLPAAMIDRLALNEKRISSMAEGLRTVASLKDEVGRVAETFKTRGGLTINKVRVPIGVIGIIYEARPNVTSDCAGLTLKSGNSVILKGGSEALNSNKAIYKVLKGSLKKAGLPEGAINLVESTERNSVKMLLKQDRYVDLIMPRGGEGLIKRVVSESRIPVIKHYKGVCHVYVDKRADMNMALKIVVNAKVQRPGVCNAMETLLVHKDIAKGFLPAAARELRKAGVEIRGCSRTRSIIQDAKKAVDSDWSAEYLDLILAVKVVSGLDEAVGHITRYGSMHSDAIITADKKSAGAFLRKVDSACVYHNASTRFTDGGQFGMGAEIGISTDKLHARGPMGLRELTTYKYVIYGDGQIRK